MNLTVYFIIFTSRYLLLHSFPLHAICKCNQNRRFSTLKLHKNIINCFPIFNFYINTLLKIIRKSWLSKKIISNTTVSINVKFYSSDKNKFVSNVAEVFVICINGKLDNWYISITHLWTLSFIIKLFKANYTFLKHLNIFVDFNLIQSMKFEYSSISTNWFPTCPRLFLFLYTRSLWWSELV